MEATQMSISRGMDREDVVHIYSGILLSHRRERNYALCRDMDGPRDYRTEWSKSEREKQILYINAYMWNLEKWYRWSYLQSRKRHRHREQIYGYHGGKGGGGMDWETEIDTYTLPCTKEIAGEKLLYKTGSPTWHFVMTGGSGMQGREGG